MRKGRQAGEAALGQTSRHGKNGAGAGLEGLGRRNRFGAGARFLRGHRRCDLTMGRSLTWVIRRRNGVRSGRFGGEGRLFSHFEYAAPDRRGGRTLRAMWPCKVARICTAPEASGTAPTAGVKSHLIGAFQRQGLRVRVAKDAKTPKRAPWGGGGLGPVHRLRRACTRPAAPSVIRAPRHSKTTNTFSAIAGPWSPLVVSTQKAPARSHGVGQPGRPRRPALSVARGEGPFTCLENALVGKAQTNGLTPLAGHGVKRAEACKGKDIAFRPTRGNGVVPATFEHPTIRPVDPHGLPKQHPPMRDAAGLDTRTGERRYLRTRGFTRGSVDLIWLPAP